MKVAILLGQRLRDDGTRTKRLDARCDLAMKYDREFGFDYLIVSGGIANEHTDISEAQRMYEYLEEHGYDVSKVIKEDKSMTTWGNMEYSMQIIRKMDKLPDTIIIITTCDHYMLKYNTIKICQEAVNDENINLLFYLDTVLRPEDY